MVSETGSCSTTASSTSLFCKLVFSVVTQISSLSSYRPESRHSSYRESVRLKIGETRLCGLFSLYMQRVFGKSKSQKILFVANIPISGFHNTDPRCYGGRTQGHAPTRTLTLCMYPTSSSGRLLNTTCTTRSGLIYAVFLTHSCCTPLLKRRKTCGYRSISCFTRPYDF